MLPLVNSKSEEKQNNFLENVLRNKSRILNHSNLINKKIEAYKNNDLDNPILKEVGLVEFHPTNKCNLKCSYCTYDDRNTEVFSFSEIDRIINLNPKALLIAGGGEPTVYSSEGKKFSDLIDYIKEKLPDVEIGLITNGVFLPPGNWQRHISWIRLSVDASDAETLKFLKGTNQIDKILDNLVSYLKSPIPYVGAGFVFNGFNIRQSAEFASKLYHYAKERVENRQLKKLNIQYRPTCPTPECSACPSEFYAKIKRDDKIFYKEVVRDREIEKFEAMRKEDEGKDAFVTKQTNYLKIKRGIKSRDGLNFNKCYITLAKWIITANGVIYPCVMKAHQFKKSMGNILEDDIKDIIKKQQSYFNLEEGFCKGFDDCCSVTCEVNHIAENRTKDSDDYESAEKNYFF